VTAAFRFLFAINDTIATGLPAVYQALGQPQLMPAVAPMPAVTVTLPQ
jgi:hypothetical protein